MKEIKGDLFTSKNSLAHCVSADFVMGRGIAVGFKTRFGRVQELLQQGKGIGEVAYLRDNDRYIFYLVTKDKYYQKPTYLALDSCLKNLSELCHELKICQIDMPLIGCGLDRLSWNRVKTMIETILETPEGTKESIRSDSSVTITIYTL